MLPKQISSRILSHFPDVDFAFGYGSAFFPQPFASEKLMYDFIFSVKNPKDWHQQNLALNRNHYSFLCRAGGISFISKVHDWGARVYYNTDIKLEGERIKYGVVSTDELERDLVYWNTLYISGRMQKPIVVLRRNETIENAHIQNLISALAAAFFSLPEYFTEEDLYQRISAFSYIGDMRMSVGENPNKVKNMVEGNLTEFHELYSPLFKYFPHLHYDPITTELKQDTKLRNDLYSLLPANVQIGISRCFSYTNPREDIKITKHTTFPATGWCMSTIRDVLKSIVESTSMAQSLKGVITAGPIKALKYAARKVKMRFAESKYL